MLASAVRAGKSASSSTARARASSSSLTVAYGKVLPDVAQDVQVRVADALTQMCGVEVSAVDVTIEELDG